uniref:Uncharacterized protein n=1 Tax=mine drainage metagenome TaxID=410659 RepID=E6QKI8_9ZZZZ
MLPCVHAGNRSQSIVRSDVERLDSSLKPRSHLIVAKILIMLLRLKVKRLLEISIQTSVNFCLPSATISYL